MNNPFNMTNDLNGFRASIGNSVAAYDHNIDVLNTGVIRRRVESTKKAAQTLAKGSELLRTGLETEGALVGGKAIGAAGKAIYGAVKDRLGSGVTDAIDSAVSDAKSAVSKATGGASDSVLGGGSTSAPAAPGGDVASPIGGNNVNPEFRAGQGTEMKSQELDDVSSERPFIDETPDPYGRADTSQRVFGETKDDMDDMDDAPDTVGDGINTQPRTDLTETKTGDAGDVVSSDAADLGADISADAADAAQAGASAASGAADVASAAGSTLTNVTSAAASAASDGVDALLTSSSAAETALTEIASSTSWIPFVGEIMGGIAAVGGLVTAGIGIYDDVKGGAQEAAADLMPTRAPNLPSANLSGSYIAPIQSSVNV
tara:strand:+ start:1959 stop:3080 length:1122 start_codon:yes stop_codon:yes gene_type:complete